MSECVVSYPEPCSEAAEVEVWGLSFCKAHGREAQIAADEELMVGVDMQHHDERD